MELPEFRAKFSPEILSRMNGLIAHGVPDNEGEWLNVEAGVGLANRRIAIIDLSIEGRQPMANENGTIQLVYNYQEIRKNLLAKGRHFKSRTDTEVLIHLYEEMGYEF